MDHLLRSVDRFVDLSEVRKDLRPYYSSIGRPSIDPELMICMLIVGYCFGIRSERRLCDEVHLNLGYCWLCWLSLDAAVPDHSTFSKARHGRFRDADLLRQVFEAVVRRCMDEGLVGGEGFAVDASMIKADANRQRGLPGNAGLTPEAANHAVREYLAVLNDGAFGAATPVVPKFISPAYPASRRTGANGGLAFFAYCTNYLIDLKCAVILDVEPTTAGRTRLRGKSHGIRPMRSVSTDAQVAQRDMPIDYGPGRARGSTPKRLNIFRSRARQQHPIGSCRH